MFFILYITSCHTIKDFFAYIEQSICTTCLTGHQASRFEVRNLVPSPYHVLKLHKLCNKLHAYG